MSRTYKDRPNWVQVRDPRVPTVEYHQHHPGGWWRIRNVNDDGRCDLAEFDAAKGQLAARWRFNCDREFAGDRHRRYRYHWGSAPRWFNHQVWFEPERVRERDQLGRAVKEFNAGVEEEWDFDFPNHQHGHCGRWLWD